MRPLRVVFCTCPERESLRLSHTLVEAGLAACVNIVPGVNSVYRWKSEICEDKEALLIIKTGADEVEEVTELIQREHSYTVPEVISLDLNVKEGNEAYLQWMVDSLGVPLTPPDVDPQFGRTVSSVAEEIVRQSVEYAQDAEDIEES